MDSLVLQRERPTVDCTFGRATSDFGFSCETLEPLDPMPVGIFLCTLRYSPHHGFAVPGVNDVPGHSDIEWHSGNIPKDTKDCVLPGDSRGPVTEPDGITYPRAVRNSRVTFRKLMVALEVPNFEMLRDWNAVRSFVLRNPGAGSFTLDIRPPLSEVRP